MTLEDILFSQGFGSRRQCRALIYSGVVIIDKQICTNPYAQFETAQLKFEVNDESWHYCKHVYIALNKPGGYECSHRPKHHASVFSLLPPQFIERNIQCVGRLDVDTTGLLLFSDDGQFIRRYTSPKHKVTKKYEAKVANNIDDQQLHLLKTGVLLHQENEIIKAVNAEKKESHLLSLSINEGKYHQVKRMIVAAENHVESLSRVAIHHFVLPKMLLEGKWMWLESAELNQLGYV